MKIEKKCQQREANLPQNQGIGAGLIQSDQLTPTKDHRQPLDVREKFRIIIRDVIDLIKLLCYALGKTALSGMYFVIGLVILKHHGVLLPEDIYYIFLMVLIGEYFFRINEYNYYIKEDQI